MRISRWCGLLCVVVFVLALGLPTRAQITTATLQGQVLDPSGGSIPNAKVTATIVANDRAQKVRVLKYKRKKQYRRTIGHRQNYSEVRINEIVVP